MVGGACSGGGVGAIYVDVVVDPEATVGGIGAPIATKVCSGDGR